MQNLQKFPALAQTKDLCRTQLLLGVGSLLCLHIYLCMVLEGYYIFIVLNNFYLFNSGIIILFLLVFLNRFYYYKKNQNPFIESPKDCNLRLK